MLRRVSRGRGFAHRKRRGVIAVQVAVAMTVIVGFAALTIDVGAIYNTKADLQRTADAAAMAAASKLAAYNEGDPTVLATALANEYTARNNVFGQAMALGDGDIQFGRAVYDAQSGSYEFTPTGTFPDAVRVRVRLTEDSPNGAMPLYFARVLGREHTSVEAEAIAMMVPRDIAIVADLSGSHTDDSELANFKKTNINLHEVWDNLPGGYGDDDTEWVGDEFDMDGEGNAPQMAGPGWGAMKRLGWGDTDLDSSYDPSDDSGLVELKKNRDWNDAVIEDYLADQGYVPDEIDAIMSEDYDPSAWDARVAVALGLARWDSGMPGGLWQQLGVSGGNGNAWVSDGELTWVEHFGDRSISDSKDFWQDYINNYMDESSTAMAKADSGFKYRFGAKTFTNYLMERRYTHDDTPELANTPEQPMHAVKVAVRHLSDMLVEQETDDQMSLEIYGTVARHEVDLTHDYDTVASHLEAMQAAHYDSYTNMGGGIQRAMEELSSERARPTARKVMFLLTDGQANVTEGGQVGNYYGGKAYAQAKAQEAVDQGIRIFTVSVGSDADISLMQELAEMGDGVHFHAEGSIEDYSDQLEQIFATLGGTRPVELIK